jgi:hypothetical protein
VSGNDKSVSTSQVAVFDLDGQAVEIKLMESIAEQRRSRHRRRRHEVTPVGLWLLRKAWNYDVAYKAVTASPP